MKQMPLIVLTAGLLATSGPLAQHVDKDGTYVWYDGGKPKRIVLDSSLVADFSKQQRTLSVPVLKTEHMRIWRHYDQAVLGAISEGKVSPVLRDGEGGRMRALPGNVIVRLDPQWTTQQVSAWLSGNGLVALGRLPIGSNVIVVSSPPGLRSLELANRLQESGTVISAQPDWWEQMELR